jgi:hypothetical protein
LVAYVLGFILQEVSRPTRPPADLAADPILARAFTTLAERDVDDRFEVGLGLIMDGVGVAPTPDPGRPGREP